VEIVEEGAYKTLLNWGKWVECWTHVTDYSLMIQSFEIK
jgi:hypothetical protein